MSGEEPMALRDSRDNDRDDYPDLSNRLLVGQIWHPERAEHDPVILRFETGTEIYPGTLKGGPILFGTLLARWDGDNLRVDWRCQTEQGFARGRTFAEVERMSGGRLRIYERWIEAEDHSRPGFLVLEEPMTDRES